MNPNFPKIIVEFPGIEQYNHGGNVSYICKPCSYRLLTSEKELFLNWSNGKKENPE